MRTRFTLAAVVVAALLDGCGGAQSGAVPQALSETARTAKGSWMLPEAKNEDLIYVSGIYDVFVFSYGGKKVGDIANVITPGVCSDADGNVWVTTQGTAMKFAHGGTTSIAEVYAPIGYQFISCAVDPESGALAATLYRHRGAVEVGVYKNASGTPDTYSDSYARFLTYCTYDNEGNLFVEGRHLRRHAALAELPSGAGALTTVALDKAFGKPAGLQWDGQYLALGDSLNHVVYQVSVSGSEGTVVNTIHFHEWRYHLLSQFWIQNGVIGFMYSRLDFGLWNYPKGKSKIRSFLNGYETKGGNAISLAPSSTRSRR